jgi:hypothetical protein
VLAIKPVCANNKSPTGSPKNFNLMTSSSEQTIRTNEKHQSLKSMARFLIFITLSVCLTLCNKTNQTPQDLAATKTSGKKALSIQPGLVSSSAFPASALLPDLQTVVPQHLQVVRAHQRDLLRFSNGVANTGAGALQFKPAFPLDDLSDQTQNAIQQLLNAAGSVVYEENVSQFEYHPEHNHWHIEAVALFEIRRGSPTGPIVGGNSLKTTFCLIDWIKLEGNSNSKERVYFDCFGDLQGISPGWVDQYNQAIEGQELDITGVLTGSYYLTSTANPDHTFIETNSTNNTAWVSFNLKRDKQDHPKISVTGYSACSGGLCGYPPNR